MKEDPPFSFLAENNIQQVARMFILRKEDPGAIAILARHLKPSLSKTLLEALPAELRAAAEQHAKAAARASDAQARAISADIQEGLAFVNEGIKHLVVLLKQADGPTREAVLDFLKKDQPSLFLRVRQHMPVFEDIACFPDAAMKSIVLNLTPDHMARALSGASPKVTDKFFENMSAGAGALLQEAMHYVEDWREGADEEARATIMETILHLDAEDRISIRPRGEDSII
ncbi:MAG: hypothetical protein HZB91_05895 [Elusimicrobia bacterium]|nr:hypothetical protein [Elusimicrobiota bacterium]